MPPDRRTLRDIQQAYRGMAEYQLQTGQWVYWFRFNSPATTSHPVYDTGPQRVWYTPPVIIPVYLGEYRRAAQNFDEDGLYLVDNVHLVMSYNSFFQSTVPDPDPYGQDHVNDRVAFDGSLFSVASFVPKGRVASYFLTISVDLRQVAQEELDEDPLSSYFNPYIVAP